MKKELNSSRIGRKESLMNLQKAEFHWMHINGALQNIPPELLNLAWFLKVFKEEFEIPVIGSRGGRTRKMKMKIDWKHFIKTRVVSEEMKDVKFFTEVINVFAKFTAGDWGITSEGDKALNDDALITGDRILASYPTSKGKIWINADFVYNPSDPRPIVIMFPSEY